MNNYEIHKEITKDVLDNIRIGDMIKVNDWKKPMKVRGVSENYFVMTQNQFCRTYYSVCEKNPREIGYLHNEIVGGKFHCGSDNMIFGFVSKNFDFNNDNWKQYDFDNQDWISEYLSAFESKEIELSERNGISINTITVKHH
ncbi:MAG: hypothetical protein RRY15_08535 [Bacteroidales bacterium]